MSSWFSEVTLLSPAVLAPYPEAAMEYPTDMQGNEMRGACSSGRSPTQADRMLVCR